MAYNFYARHPVVELFGSFFDDDVNNRSARCEGGPCGPNSRWRHHHRGHHPHHPRSEESKPEVIRPAADIYSTETEYKVYISLPSADKETIELTYGPETRELVVSGKLLRPAEFANLDDEALKNVLVQGERRVGAFERKLKIPNEESGERIRFQEAVAKFENGVLELSLPKVEKEGPKTIVID